MHCLLVNQNARPDSSRLGSLHWLGLLLALALSGHSQAAVLKQSDVVFMYRSGSKNLCRVRRHCPGLGGKPTPESTAQNRGIRVFGSVGMVTEFNRYYERFPQSYEEGLCRDVFGQPLKVPWLTDHQHKGVPYWWCCTQQPLFRQYLRERVIETVKAGADGVHIDDHLGSAGGLWLGQCFCDRCVEGFRDYLKSKPVAELKQLGIESVETFNYREVVKNWLDEDTGKQRKPTQHALWEQWSVYQCRAAAAFMQTLRELAASTAGHPVPIGANAGLLWPRHLVDYQSLDLFSAETDHHASEQRFSDVPLFAYRLADAVQRPYASTASGGDWAYIKEHQLPGLVRGWIALSYAAGHRLMAPHRQWCYTPEKGTHWYQGPTDQFAPLYQFVRQNAALLDDYQAVADVAIVLPHRAFTKDPQPWFRLAQQLTAKNVSYRLLFGGDELVMHPLTATDLASAPVLLVPDRSQLLPADRALLERHNPRIVVRVEEALAAVTPAVKIESGGAVRALARTNLKSAVIHLLNYSYDPAHDAVAPLQRVRVRPNLQVLGLPADVRAWLVEPGAKRQALTLADGVVEVPVLGLWGMLVLEP